MDADSQTEDDVKLRQFDDDDLQHKGMSRKKGCDVWISTAQGWELYVNKITKIKIYNENIEKFTCNMTKPTDLFPISPVGLNRNF